MYDTGVRIVPLDGCYILQRYRPDFNDWVTFAVFDDAESAIRRYSVYVQPTYKASHDTHQQA